MHVEIQMQRFICVHCVAQGLGRTNAHCKYQIKMQIHVEMKYKYKKCKYECKAVYVCRSRLSQDIDCSLCFALQTCNSGIEIGTRYKNQFKYKYK